MIKKISLACLFTCASILAGELKESEGTAYVHFSARAFEQNDVEAMVSCALMLATGNGIEQDYTMAISYLKSAMSEAWNRVSEPHLLEYVAEVLVFGLNNENLGQDETRAAIFKDRAAERHLLNKS